MQIVIAHDAPARAMSVIQVLTAAGHVCHACSPAPAEELLLSPGNCELLIVVISNAAAATALVHAARRTGAPELPILMVVQGRNTHAITAAMAAGANDYIVEPLRANELMTRVQVLLKRLRPEQDALAQWRLGDYLFNLDAKRLSKVGDPIPLTQKEFEVALLFFKNLGQPLSRAYILETIWAQEPDMPSRTMDTHVSRVRTKLKLTPENGFRLTPVYGYGYVLEQLTASTSQ